MQVTILLMGATSLISLTMLASLLVPVVQRVCLC